TARATRPFNSYPHDPPQSGNAPVLLTHIQGHLRSPEDTRTGTSRKARSGRGHTDARGGGRGVGEGTVILLLILAAGLLGGNELVSVSAAVLLLLRASGLGHAFRFLEEHGLDLGI